MAAIAIGADDAGAPLKEHLAAYLREHGYEVKDFGNGAGQDYPDVAAEVAEAVARGEHDRALLVCGTGLGMAITANKVPGVRASLCYDISTARNSREHNHANVLTLGAGLIGEALAWQIVEEWLSVEWGGGRHARRVAKIDEIEQRYSAAVMQADR